MKKRFHYTGILLGIIFLFSIGWSSNIKETLTIYSSAKPDTIPDDSIIDVQLPYEFKDESFDPTDKGSSGGLFLSDPANVKDEVVYDPVTGQYVFNRKIGNMDYRPPSYMSFEEYLDYDMEKSLKNYWKQRNEAENITQAKGIIPKIHVGGEVFDRIFGGNTVDIRPQGSAELIFALNTNRTKNPALAERQRKVTTFDFNQKIQLNVIGKIGDKLKLTTNYNTEATFDFENQMKLEYTGYEDEIIKKIEAGNVTLPLNGSLITGSQSLFGIKTQLQFGRLTVTSIFSQQKGKKSEVEVQGGAQTNNFEIRADNYESNKHFFLSRYFRENYDAALSQLPVINSVINITRVEVWKTNRNTSVNETRNIIALDSLGESKAALAGLPNNNVNRLDPANFAPGTPIRSIQSARAYLENNFDYVQARDFEKLQDATKLAATEYTFNPRLGYISLNNGLNNDEVLAVAYQYTLNGKTYQVGEFSTDGVAAPNALLLKLLKTTKVNVRSLSWDLMMKNVYSIGAYQISPTDFRLDVFHSNFQNGTDINTIPEGGVKGKLLLQVVQLDRLNQQLSPSPDGVFDYIDGVLINSANGRIFFPVIEPFGSNLYKQIAVGGNEAVASKYAYTELYDSTKTAAQLVLSKNRFKLKGSYQSSSSSEISLNAVNVPQGSVVVTAGGVALVENSDYTVDYNLGRVKIINEGILRSNTPIKVSLESNQLFNIQSKSLIGAHFDYKVNKDFNLGATILNLTERPITQKINIGDEPISNTIWGLDGNYRTDAPSVTKIVDKLPFLETKEMSTVTVSGEFAQLVPGHAKAINVGKDKGTSFVDDFEGSQSSIDLRQNGAWSLASTPQGQDDLFPEAKFSNDRRYGFNRARISSYVIDPLFWRDNALTPDHIKGSPEQSNNFTREVLETEIFPNKQQATSQPTNVPVFDLAFYPKERGPYNYDAKGFPGISAGLNGAGLLNQPETRWGGLMRKLETNDFEAANVEYIQFWVMDPFDEDNGTPNLSGGNLYFNLGDVSEDVLRDNYKTYENGLPTTPTAVGSLLPEDTASAWGRLTLSQAIVNAFDNNPSARALQDVGLDGLKDENEKEFFRNYLDSVGAVVSSQSARDSIFLDPSADNFKYFRSSSWDNSNAGILQRYKFYSGIENNSSVDQPDGYPVSSTTIPNVEDVNRDNTLSDNESYYQYRVPLDPNNMEVGKNFITDVVTGTGQRKDGTPIKVKWYQFKVPIKTPERRVGEIQDFRSIRFMRMFLKGFNEKIILRFARLELIRGEWRRYDQDLLAEGEYIPDDQFGNTLFNISAVNVEENSSRSPINYVLPPGVTRETNIASANLAQLNEQSLALDVCDLQDGDARAAFRNVNIDVRQYGKLKMYVHAEAGNSVSPLKDNDLKMFVRLGKDFSENYYEYEFPLYVTPWHSTSAQEIWPGENPGELNNMEIDFEQLQTAKQDRNIKMFSDSNVSLQERHSFVIGDKVIYVKGNPNLSDVQTIMIGIKNPKREEVSDADDGLSKCAEIWVNELRLTDFNEKGGWAANARITTKLADFGTLTLAGSKRTPGFGSIEQKINERSREDITQYDVSSNLELGKFFPEKIGIRIPMFVNQSESYTNPQYNPLDPDIKLKSSLNIYPNEEQKDSVKRIVQDYSKRRGINFTNIKKEKTKGATKSHIYDVENLSFSYSYNETYRRNTNIDHNTIRNYRGGIAYNYSTNPKNIKPFAKSKLLKSESFRIVKDFNFNTMPSRLAFRTDIDRNYSENQVRNLGFIGLAPPPTFSKTFTINRLYDFKYDLTKNLNFDFNASNTGRIHEPEGRMDKNLYEDEYKLKRDTILKSFFSDPETRFGTTTQYHHTSNLTYNLPINKIPIFNWVTGTVRYTANYDWTRSALALPGREDTLGHTIQNSNTKQYNAQLNMVQLYNKIPYFKKLNQSKPQSGKNAKPIPKAKTGTAPADTTKKKEEKEKDFKILDHVARLIMTVKTISGTYSENNGTLLPGYRLTTKVLGKDDQFDGPSTGFIFGKQNDFEGKDFPRYAADKGWLYPNQYLNSPHTTSNTKTFNGRANLEPFKDMKIELTANRTISNNKNSFFRYNDSIADWREDSPVETGNFSISYVSWRTAFTKDNDEDEHTSEIFQKFLDSRAEISTRLKEQHPDGNLLTKDSTGFTSGYGETAQDVLIPAFLAAYSGKDERFISLNTFPKIPKINWRVTYDGLSKLESVKKYFKTVTLGHAYRSSYNVASYTTNLNYRGTEDGFSEITNVDANGNFISQNQISTISLSDQFNPLLNIDMTWNNSLLTKIEVKKDRNVSLSFSNNQVTEVKGTEWGIELGYRFKNVALGLPGSSKDKKKIQSDLNIRSRVSLRENNTIIRKVVEQTNQPTAGQRIIKIENSADYVVNERLNVRLFFDKIITQPIISNTFETGNTNAGVSVRFTLQ